MFQFFLSGLPKHSVPFFFKSEGKWKLNISPRHQIVSPLHPNGHPASDLGHYLHPWSCSCGCFAQQHTVLITPVHSVYAEHFFFRAMKPDSSPNSSAFQPENLYYRKAHIWFKAKGYWLRDKTGAEKRFLSVFTASISALLEGNLKTLTEKWFTEQPKHKELKLKREKLKLKCLVS